MDSSILTLILLAPLAGAVLVALLPDRGKLSAWLALLTTLGYLWPDSSSSGAFRCSSVLDFQFVVNRQWIENPGNLLSRRCRRAEPVADCPGRASWSCRRAGKLELDQSPAENFLFALSPATDGDVWRLHLAGPDALLRLLGTVARSHGDPDCDVRPQGRIQRRQSSSSSSPLFLRPRCLSRSFTCMRGPAHLTSANCN